MRKRSPVVNSMISWCKEIIGATVIAAVVGILVWFFGSVIGGTDIHIAFVVRAAFFLTLIVSVLLRTWTIAYIFYQAFTRRVKYRDMSEAVRVYKMHKKPGFKDLREQAFMDVLIRKRAVRDISQTIVDDLFAEFFRP